MAAGGARATAPATGTHRRSYGALCGRRGLASLSRDFQGSSSGPRLTTGQNLRIDYRFVGDSPERTAEGPVALGPDVIFVSTNPVVAAVLRATRTIPVVFTWVSDSVGSGYVTSLAHPGGNITGFHNYEPALDGKWLEVLKEVSPSVGRVAVVHVPEITANVAFIRVAEAASSSLGVSVSAAGVRDAADVVACCLISRASQVEVSS